MFTTIIYKDIPVTHRSNGCYVLNCCFRTLQDAMDFIDRLNEMPA